MKTVKFLKHIFVVSEGFGLPEGVVYLRDMSDQKLVELHNLLALNLERRHGGRVRTFKSRKIAEKQIKAKLLLWDNFDPEEYV